MSRRHFLTQAGLAAAGLGSLATAHANPPATPTAAAEPIDVKITAVEAFLVPSAVLVAVQTDAGVTGWGECAYDGRGLMVDFVEERLRRHVVGRPVMAVRPVWDQMFFENHDLGPGGALPNAIAGIDLALWDVRGKLLGVPVASLLGGPYRTSIPAYGSVPVARGRVSVDEAVRSCVRLVEEGYRAVKIRMQIREHYLNPDPDPTFAYAAAVRKAIGDQIVLMIDANNGYSAQRAISTALRLYEQYNVTYIEDPVSDQNLAELGPVAAALDHVEVVAGEKCYTRWQIRDLIVQGNPDIINPDVVKVGGLTEMDRIATLSSTFHKPIQLHNTRPTLATAASLHSMAAMSLVAPFLEFPELTRFGDLLALFGETPKPRQGLLHLPTGPGLGIEVDEAAVRRAATARQRAD